MRKLLPIIVALLSAISLQAAAIKVGSQADFSKLRDSIIAAASGGAAEINVEFVGGRKYVFTQNMLNLSAQRYPGVSLVFRGNGAEVIGTGTSEEAWSPVYVASGRVTPVKRKSGEYLLRCPGIIPEKAVTHILLTEWYQSRIYRISSIKEGEVTFFADNGSELNMDYEFSGSYSRFKFLYAGSTAPSVNRKAKGNAGRLLSTYGAAFKSVSFSGFHFAGNCNEGCLLDFTDLDTEAVKISDCEFSGIHSDVVRVSAVKNFSFTNNTVRDCYRSGVFADNKSKNARVVGNSFTNCGLALDMTSCVDCSGTGYYIADNVFRNFGSRAVSVGVYFTVDKVCESSGIVENNVMFYDSEWLDHIQDYTLMDTGAIYVTTFSDDAVIRFNHIYDYDGMKDNRGIFCDDGSTGFSIYGNVVTGIRNSFAIDARRTPKVELQTGRKVNVNNYVGNNVVDGAIRFEGRLLGGFCSRDGNYVLCRKDAGLPANIVSSVSDGSNDVRINCESAEDGLVYLSWFELWRMRRWKYYSEMSGCFRRNKTAGR